MNNDATLVLPDAAARAPTRYRLLRALVLIYLSIGALTRVLLWARFARDEQVSIGQLLLGVLPIGFVNDLAQAVYLCVPIGLVLWLAPSAAFERRGLRRAAAVAVTLVLFGMLYLATMEVLFFDEFNARFNLVAVDYLIYPTEVIGNIRDTYPVLRISAILLLLSIALSAALWRCLLPRGLSDAATLRRRSLYLAAHLLAVLLLALGLRADSFNFFDNRVANELADNGPANFFAAFRTNQLEYPQFYRTIEPARADALLRADLGRGGPGFVPGAAIDMTRHVDANPAGLGALNIVVLVEESLGAEYVGAYGDSRHLTPNFDALSREGLLFTHAYSTGTRTVRGLEAISASFPPIPSESIVKRPGFENVMSWAEVLATLDYHSSFLYGGYGSFDNMNAYFAGNGFAISDRADIAAPKFANIWGVSDEDLFTHAIRYFDARAKARQPFFSIVMSTSNHKPFTFPEGIAGVRAKGGGRRAGARYADYAIGRFFAAARGRDWYRNTVFVIVADHGARVYGAADIPLNSYEIPLLILAPGRIAPARIDTLASQIDIAPTVMGLLGLPYDAPFFGQDVLHWQGGARTLLFNHNHDVALLRAGELAILGLNRKAEVLSYHRRAGPPSKAVDDFHPAPFDADLVDLATAYYQTGYRLFTEPHRRQ